jgi:hypothetical protein
MSLAFLTATGRVSGRFRGSRELEAASADSSSAEDMGVETV